MNDCKKKMTLYDYIEPLLENSTTEEIALAKKRYWNNYKAAWRKQRRKERKEFTIDFTAKELQIIKSAAGKHKRSYTKFIKQSTLAYCQNKYLPTDPIAINQVKELLAMTYNGLQQLTDDEMLHTDTGNIVMKKVAALENNVLSILYNPKTIEQWLSEILADNPANEIKIIEFLNQSKNDT
jgi:hypothetical protein